MDQTEKIVQQSNSPKSSQNNPESSKGSKALPNNQASSFLSPGIASSTTGQNCSQHDSIVLSRTGSQMDEQIMKGISRKQKKRYTTFLEALGIDVKSKLSKGSDQPIQDGQNFSHQKSDPNPIQEGIRQPDQPNEQLIPFEEAQGQEKKNSDGENYSLIETELKTKTKSRDLSQRSDGIHKLQKLDSQMLNMGNQPDHILEPQIQIVPLEPVPLKTSNVKLQFKKNSQDQHISTQPKLPHQNQDFHINDTFNNYTSSNLKIEPYHQSEGEISMDNNYDPASVSRPFSEFSYDMINSIYTPVSQQRAPVDDSNAVSIENNSKFASIQEEVAIEMEQFKQIIQEQRDFEIDGPSRPVEDRQDNNLQINFHVSEERTAVERDVEIDGPSENHSIAIQNKDFQIDGPSIDHQTPEEVSIDGPSLIYQTPQELLKNTGSNQSLEIQRPSQETSLIQSHHKSQKGQRSSLHIVQEAPNEQKSQANHVNQLSNREARQTNLNIFNPSAKIFKAQSQNNDKPNSAYPRPKKNSQTSSFQNQDLFRTAEMNHNRRKFSQSSRSAGLNSVNNKVSSNKRPSQYVQGSNGSFALSQNIFDSREINSLHEPNESIIEIEEQIDPHDSIKMTPNGNSFSNRSEKSSIHSKRSNRFSDEMFNEKQVPQLDGLQLVRDGKEARLERKSRSSENSNRSHHSRSASTCKKSYDDLSEIRMQKIDEGGQEFEQKSIKRSLHRIYTPEFSVDEVEGQKPEIGHEEVEVHERNYNQDIEIDGRSDEIQIDQSGFTKRIENYSIETTYFRPQEQKFVSQRKDNLTQNVSHQITIHFENQQEEKPIFNPKSVQYSNISQTSNKKTTESQKKRQKDEYLQEQKRRKMVNMSLVAAFRIQIDNPLPMEQRLENVLIFCKQYLSDSHHSNYEREKFKQIVQTNFQFFGSQLDPTTDLGQRILHDGIFACAFISFVKENKKSGMLESLMFTQFEQQVGIRTNKDIFLSELKRVREQREMHYNNEFEKRYKEHEERKAKEQAKKMQMNKNVFNQTVLIEPKPQESKVTIDKMERKDEQKKEKIARKSNRIAPNLVWEAQLITEESNSSARGSSQTITVDQQKDSENSPIKKVRISDTAPVPGKPAIKQTESVLTESNTESSFESWFAQPSARQQKESEAKNPPKKRITKKKDKKLLDAAPAIVVKSQQDEGSCEQTVSQVKQRLPSNRKPEKPETVTIKEPQTLGQKQKMTKGILKGSRAVRTSHDYPQKKQKRSLSKKQIEKGVSRKKKLQISKDKNEPQLSSRPLKSQQKARGISPGYQELDISVTISPRNKLSIQKAVQDKVNQPKTVKFTESTKGGQASSNKIRKNARMLEALPEEQPQQASQNDDQQGKRTLRSRSKK